ncbi:MAG: SH3 domain-containing protein, partial [Oscillospiraceae bacterium]|nr:SH3 domain-containing protein [Oscillospiraceae bacterium]
GTAQQQIEYVNRTQNAMQTVSPSYFDIVAGGSLQFNAPAAGFVDTMHKSGISVVPFLSNHWDRAAGVAALNNIDLLSDKIAYYIEQYNLDGVNVDIENVTQTERAKYTALVTQLRNKIPANKEVSVAVAANPNNWTTGWHGSYDYSGLAENSDYLMIMAYDEHYQGGTAGPVASLGFVENSIKYALSKTTPDKIVIGLPFFGRIWGVGNTNISGYGVPIATVNKIISTYNAVVSFDTESMSPKAEFTINKGDPTLTLGGTTLSSGSYVIWYENDNSLAEKLSLVNKYNLKGAGSWALGQEDPRIWNNYKEWLNGDSLLEAGYFEYTVKAGDTLWKLSQTYKTTVEQLTRINGISGDVIYVGQVLRIPIPQTPTVPATTAPTTTVPQTTIAQTTVPQTTIPQTTIPQTTIPQTTVPQTTVPQTTAPLPTSPTVLPTQPTAYTAWVVQGLKNLNVRSGPGAQYSVITKLKSGAAVTVLEQTTSGFYKIALNGGKYGYVSSLYLTAKAPGISAREYPGIVSPAVASLNVRSGAGKNKAVIARIKGGESVTIIGEAVKGFYRVRVNSTGITGYCETNYILRF